MKLPIIDVGSICVGCGRDTCIGSGLFINRIPSDKIWSVNQSFDIEVDGYLCRDCQLVDCDHCGDAVFGYVIIDGSIVCDDCLENEKDCENCNASQDYCECKF